MANYNVNEIRKRINDLVTDAQNTNSSDALRLAALAEAYAYWKVLQDNGIQYPALIQNNENGENIIANADEPEVIDLDVGTINERMQWANASDAFSIAQRSNNINSLTNVPIQTLEQHIQNVNETLNQYAAGNENSAEHAGSIFRQFSNTWRIARNSNEFEAAKRAMQSIADSPTPPTQMDNYLAAEIVKKYVIKNLNKAKSAVGMTRMACALSFLKQTMTDLSFKNYCNNLNYQRGFHANQIFEDDFYFDKSEPRCIVPDEIGTVSEVYNTARENLRKYNDNEGREINPRDIAILTALKTLERNGSGNKIVEHEALQNEIEKIENDRRFQDAIHNVDRENLIDLAWRGKLDTLENYAKPIRDRHIGDLNAFRNANKQNEDNGTQEILNIVNKNNTNDKIEIIDDINEIKPENDPVNEIENNLKEDEKEENIINIEPEPPKEKLLSEFATELVPALKKIAEPARLRDEEEKLKKEQLEKEEMEKQKELDIENSTKSAIKEIRDIVDVLDTKELDVDKVIRKHNKKNKEEDKKEDKKEDKEQFIDDIFADLKDEPEDKQNKEDAKKTHKHGLTQVFDMLDDNYDNNRLELMASLVLIGRKIKQAKREAQAKNEEPDIPMVNIADFKKEADELKADKNFQDFTKFFLDSDKASSIVNNYFKEQAQSTSSQEDKDMTAAILLGTRLESLHREFIDYRIPRPFSQYIKDFKPMLDNYLSGKSSLDGVTTLAATAVALQEFKNKYGENGKVAKEDVTKRVFTLKKHAYIQEMGKTMFRPEYQENFLKAYQKNPVNAESDFCNKMHQVFVDGTQPKKNANANMKK